MALRFGILLGVRSSPTLSQILAVGVLGAALCGVAVAWSLRQTVRRVWQSARENRSDDATSNASSNTLSRWLFSNRPASSPLSACTFGIECCGGWDPRMAAADPARGDRRHHGERRRLLQFATATKRALEAQGFRLFLTPKETKILRSTSRSARCQWAARRGLHHAAHRVED